MGKQIDGLTQHGYTGQTFEIANKLVRSAEARNKLIALLNEADTFIRYSNQDFDRKQQMAAFLADLMRK